MSSYKKIIITYTNGGYRPSIKDKKESTYLIDGKCQIIRGEKSTIDYEIVVSLCGNFGYTLERKNNTHYPLTQVQFERMAQVIAHLCLTYDLSVDNSVYNGSTTKTEITFIPYCPNIPSNCIETYLRTMVKSYVGKFKKGHEYEKQTKKSI